MLRPSTSFRRKLRLVALSVSLIALIACRTGGSHDDSEVKVIGGTPTDASSPYARSTVAIYITNADDTKAICTGTILHKRLVLTAAHCFSKANPEQQPVLIFRPDTFEAVASEATASQQWWRNQAFNPQQLPPTQPGLYRDIAMLLLPAAFTLPAGYAPVVLPLTPVSLAPGQQLVAAGYGVTSNQNGNSIGKLHHLPVQVLNVFQQAKEITLSGGFGHSVCSGDSGGPAYLDQNGTLVLVALTSRVASLPCLGNSPTIHTDVRAYMDWIKLFEEDVGQPMSQWRDGNATDPDPVPDPTPDPTPDPDPVAPFTLGVGIAQVALPGDPTPWVMFNSVTPGGRAYNAGLRTNDLVRRINNNVITSIANFDQRMEQAVASGSVNIAYRRKVGNQWVDGESAPMSTTSN